MRATFRDLIAANKRNSVLLVAVFVLFVAALALVLALAAISLYDPQATQHIRWQEGILAGLVAAGIAFFFSFLGYFSGANMILGMSGAKPLAKRDDPQLYNVVEEMAIAAGIPMPQVYLILDSAPNAFATGRDPEHAVVAITSGLRTKLNREELEGVIAHEIAHIRNYDIRLMLLLTVLIGTVVMLSDFFWQLLRFSPPRGRSSSHGNDRDKGGNPLMLVLVVVAIILAILAPILAQIIQLAVSRQREYLADASAVQLTRNPQGLANALKKIDQDPDVLETANRGTAHLFIANPIKRFEARASSMFASHPPMQDRIARLEALVR